MEEGPKVPESGGSEGVTPELVRRAREGDEAAARALFQRYAPHFQERVRQGIPAYLRAKIAPSDIVQEAWIRAFQALGRFSGDSEADFRRWLATIVLNRLLDEVRRYAAQRRDVGREAASAPDVRGMDPTVSSVAMEAEVRAAIWKAVDGLPPDQRLILHLVFEMDKSFVEAGELMERSSDAARKLFARALRSLTERIEADGRGTNGKARP